MMLWQPKKARPGMAGSGAKASEMPTRAARRPGALHRDRIKRCVGADCICRERAASAWASVVCKASIDMPRRRKEILLVRREAESARRGGWIAQGR